MANKLHEYIESLSLEEREQYKELIQETLERDRVIQHSRKINEKYCKYLRQSGKKMEEASEKMETELGKLEILAAEITGKEIKYH